jgi:Fe-S cluster assembly protein SufD
MTVLTDKSIPQQLLEAMPSDSLFGIREEAASLLHEKGIPSKRHEDWKYTNIKRLFDNGLSPVAGGESLVPRPSTLVPDSPTVRFINGSVISEWPTIEGVTFTTLAEAGDLFNHIGKSGIHAKQELAALNTMLFTDALIIHVKRNAQVEGTLVIDHLVSTKDGELHSPRILIVLEEGRASSVCIISTERKFLKSLVNHVTEAFIGANASLEMSILQELPHGNLVNTAEIQVERDGRSVTNTVQLQGKLLRNNVNVRIAGQNAQGDLNGFYMLDGTDLFDNHTIVDHLVPNCLSNETYKGLLSGRSTGVFNGKVHVHRDAQKTNAYQQNKNILLSDTATMNSKPELEIYADDVKCSHGSTTGQLDEDAVFYLRSRGLSHHGAIALLLTAFASEVLDSVSDEALRAMLEEKVQQKLAGME